MNKLSKMHNLDQLGDEEEVEEVGGKSQNQTGTVAVSRSELRHQPPDPFSGSKLTVAPDAKNAFDVMGKAPKRNKKNALIH